MVCREVELARHLEALGLCLDPVELDAMVDHDALATHELPEEVEVPPRTAELAVGGKLQTYLLLFGKELGNFLVLDALQLRGRDLALLAFGARLFERRRAQQATDHVGAEWWSGRCHGHLSSWTIDGSPQFGGGDLDGVLFCSV